MVKAFIQPCFCLGCGGKGGGGSSLADGKGDPGVGAEGEERGRRGASMQRFSSGEAGQLPVSPFVAPEHPSPTLFFGQCP